MSKVQRTVSPRLGVAIFILPPVFAWFTLRKGYSKAARIISFLWLGFIGYNAGLDVTDSPPKSVQSVASEAPAAAEAECQQDLKCWGEKYSIDAAVYCRKPIERISKYSFEWTDGMFEPRFSHYRWKDQSKGYITYVGDKIKLQNGFGAWIDYTYECDFDPAANAVLDIRAGQGRL